MSRHRHQQSRFGILVVALASLTMAGCASSMRTASDSTPEAVVAGSAKNAGFWGRVKSWMPKSNANIAEAQEVENPGKLHLAYANWQEKLGNLVEARESYELALGDNPKSVDAILGLARLDQLNQRSFDAEQRYQKALKLKPNDPDVLDAVGQFYASQERWKKSIDLLSQAVQKAPQDASYRFNLAVALARSGQIEEAMPHFSQTVGDAEAHYNVGYILHQKNDMVGAERHLLQAVVARPDLVQAQQMLDEIRRNQSDRAMFANSQPAHGQQHRTSNRQVAAQDANVAAGSAIQTAHQTGSNFRNVVPASPKSAATTGASRGHYPPSYQQPAATNYATATDRGNTQPHGSVTPPPWHTSGQAVQPHSQPAPSTGNPPGVAQPTPEQLEQWRNQFGPAASGQP